MDVETGRLLILQREMFVEWEITNYFSKEQTYLASDRFYFSGGQCSFVIYPNGSADSSGWVSLYLRMKSSNSHREAISYELGIQKKDGSVFYSIKGEAKLDGACIYGSNKFLPLSEMPKFSKDGETSIRIFCIIRLLDNQAVEDKSPFLWHKCAHTVTLADNLKDLYFRECYTDIILNVKDREFRAHKSILSARSPVFSAMLKENTSESLSGEVNITDCDPHSFQRFLVYLYSRKMEILSCDDSYSLYVIADKYGLLQLKKECVECMILDLSTDSFCDIILIAISLNEDELLKIATDFLISHMLEILSTEKWLIFLKDHYRIANELFIKTWNYHLASENAANSI